MMVHGCQLDIAWENKAENFRRVRFLLSGLKIAPGSLIVLPEMFATGFSMNTRSIAEPVNGPTTSFLMELAREYKAYVLGGFVRQVADRRPLNETVCLSPAGKCVGRYDKLQTFSPGAESKHYSAGDRLVLFRWAGLKVAIFICYDLRFPELFRLAVRRGAQAFAVIANWPVGRHSHWLALLKARAIENQAYVIGVNRCGRDPKLNYAGGSMVIDPQGNIVASAGQLESAVSAELNASTVTQWRREFPALKDNRTSISLRKNQRR